VAKHAHVHPWAPLCLLLCCLWNRQQRRDRHTWCEERPALQNYPCGKCKMMACRMLKRQCCSRCWPCR
jgi:hypothetical protein